MDFCTIKKLVFDFYGIPDAVACGRRSTIYRRARYACLLLMKEYVPGVQWIDISRVMQWGYSASSHNAYNRACQMRRKDRFFLKQLELIEKLLAKQ